MAADTSSPSLVTPQQSRVPAVDSFITGKKKKKEKNNAPFSSSVTSKKAASLTRSRPLGRRQQHTQTNQERRNNNKAKTKISVPNRFEEEVIASPDGSKSTHRGKPFTGELWMRVVRSLSCRRGGAGR